SGQLLLKADRLVDEQRLAAHDAQIQRDVHRVHAALGTDARDGDFAAARLDVVVELGDAADDEVVGLPDGAAVIRLPGNRLAASIRRIDGVGGAVAELAAVEIDKLGFGYAGVEAFVQPNRFANLAEGRVGHQRAALGD